MKYSVVDANLEGILELLKNSDKASDTWTRRASRHLESHLCDLRSREGYHSIDRYKRAIKDLNRLLEMKTAENRIRLGLGNFEHQDLAPTRSRDLIKAAENPEANPFYPYFKNRLLHLVENDQPSMVGFSLNYLSQALTTFAMIGFLRKEFPAMTLILGGGLVTSWMRRPGWQNPFKGLVDHFVAGPGEGPLLSIMGVRDTGSGEIGNLHCTPCYDPLPVKDYFAPGAILPYASSSGCYWNRCSFCPERAEGNAYVPVAIETMIADLQALVKKIQAGSDPSGRQRLEPGGDEGDRSSSSRCAMVRFCENHSPSYRSGFLFGLETIRMRDVEDRTGIWKPGCARHHAERD